MRSAWVRGAALDTFVRSHHTAALVSTQRRRPLMLCRRRSFARVVTAGTGASKLRSVCSPTARGGRAAGRGQLLDHLATYAGSLRLPRYGIGARYGLSVSTSSRSAGTAARGLRAALRPWGRSRCRESTGRSRWPARGRPRPASPVKQWNTPRRPAPALLREDAQRVVFGLARVNHDRQIAARAPAASCARNTACCTSRGEKS